MFPQLTREQQVRIVGEVVSFLGARMVPEQVGGRPAQYEVEKGIA
jgi:hypothetical protein